MKRNLLSIISFSFFLTSVQAQTQFWSDDFETATAPNIRVPSNEGGTGAPANTAYFKRTGNAGIDLATISDGNYTGFQGSWFWAGEDHDAAFGAGNMIQTIIWTVDISGQTGISFRGLFAAQATNAAWDHTRYGNTHTDFVVLEYSIDGGTYQRLIAFYSDNIDDKRLAEAFGTSTEGTGTVLTKSFNEFSKPIAETGSTLTMRLSAYSNNTHTEEWAIDNFRLFSTGALPVTLTAFTVSEENGNNRLNWRTTDEENSLHFEIERSTNGTDFEKIGVVKAAGNSNSEKNYRYVDVSPEAVSHYRLKQVDADGAFKYSETVVARIPPNDEIEIYPNPVLTDEITIRSSILSDRNTQVELYDMNGRRIPVRFSGEGISRRANINGLAKGTYFLRVENGDRRITRTIVK